MNEAHEYLFLQNFSPEARSVPVSSGAFDLLAQAPVSDVVPLQPWGSTVLRRAR